MPAGTPPIRRYARIVVTLTPGTRSAAHFWTGPRRTLVEDLLRIRLPPGAVVVEVVDDGRSRLHGVDGAYRWVTAGTRAGPPALGSAARRSLRADLLHLPLAEGSVDGVILLDVLARLDDDRAAVAEAARALRPGGAVVVTVPVLPWLWGPHDEQAGHRRRYRTSELVATLQDLGLFVDMIRRYQFFLSPLFVASRLAARRAPALVGLEHRPPSWIGRGLEAVNRAEVALARRVPRPWGTSVVVLARRP